MPRFFVVRGWRILTGGVRKIINQPKELAGNGLAYLVRIQISG